MANPELIELKVRDKSGQNWYVPLVSGSFRPNTPLPLSVTDYLRLLAGIPTGEEFPWIGNEGDSFFQPDVGCFFQTGDAHIAYLNTSGDPADGPPGTEVQTLVYGYTGAGVWFRDVLWYKVDSAPVWTYWFGVYNDVSHTFTNLVLPAHTSTLQIGIVSGNERNGSDLLQRTTLKTRYVTHYGLSAAIGGSLSCTWSQFRAGVVPPGTTELAIFYSVDGGAFALGADEIDPQSVGPVNFSNPGFTSTLDLYVACRDVSGNELSTRASIHYTA